MRYNLIDECSRVVIDGVGGNISSYVQLHLNPQNHNTIVQIRYVNNLIILKCPGQMKYMHFARLPLDFCITKNECRDVIGGEIETIKTSVSQRQTIVLLEAHWSGKWVAGKARQRKGVSVWYSLALENLEYSTVLNAQYLSIQLNVQLNNMFEQV